MHISDLKFIGNWTDMTKKEQSLWNVLMGEGHHDSIRHNRVNKKNS